MSAYRSCKTQFRNKKVLGTVLGKRFQGVQVHEVPQPITGFGHVEHAEIVVPGKINNKYTDMGFARTANGTFELKASDYDKHYLNQDWLKEVSMEYAEEQANQTAAENECDLESREVMPNGAVRLRFAVNGGA